MENCIDKIIVPLVSCIGLGVISIIRHVYKRKRDERKNKKLGVMIISSLLEDVKTGLDILKNKQRNYLTRDSWKGEETIPDEVMLIISAVYKDENKSEKFSPKDIKKHCKIYFGNIVPYWNKILDDFAMYEDWQKMLELLKNNENWQKIQECEKTTEKIIDMLECTKLLLEKNS